MGYLGVSGLAPLRDVHWGADPDHTVQGYPVKFGSGTGLSAHLGTECNMCS